jgi:Na+/pantothenate symporter
LLTKRKNNIYEGDYFIFIPNEIMIEFQGGLKAVIWVDAFQGIIMLAGILAILIKVTYPDYSDKGNIYPDYSDKGNIYPDYSDKGNIYPDYSDKGNIHPDYCDKGNILYIFQLI